MSFTDAIMSRVTVVLQKIERLKMDDYEVMVIKPFAYLQHVNSEWVVTKFPVTVFSLKQTSK